MRGYKTNIEKDSAENDNFRKVLYTSKYSQLVLMSLLPKEEINFEIHPDRDQFFRFESGEGKVFVDESEYDVSDGDIVMVPAGARHNVVNTSDTIKLKLYTLYSPAEHMDGVIRKTKADAEAQPEEFDGKTTE